LKKESKLLKNPNNILNLQVIDKEAVANISAEDCPFFEKSEVTKDQALLDFNIMDPFTEDKKDIFEAKLYIERSPDLKILVNSKPANTFQLNETINFFVLGKEFQIKFELVEGEGTFWGHIYYSNRPSRSNRDQFQAFDWMIGLRTVKRSSNCRICTKISIT